MFSYPLQCTQTCIFFPKKCAEISVMHISTSTRVCSYVSDCLRLFSRDTWTMVEKVWSQFMSYCGAHSQGMYAYYLMHGWIRLLQSCRFVVTALTKALSMDACQIIVEWEIHVNDVLFSHLAHKMLYRIKEEIFFETGKSLFILIYSASIYLSFNPETSIHFDTSILSFSKYLLNIYNMSICVHGLSIRDYY